MFNLYIWFFYILIIITFCVITTLFIYLFLCYLKEKTLSLSFIFPATSLYLLWLGLINICVP